ncbi:conserved protein of unknown function [Pseudomonas marincola]|uniref:Uncharacterized protein n=1 Tax=Pseudomonas marincola TaxID=437900 RepID=A0A653E034_9PSED|nr:conserved protein of unknown function [Pseudomonas marincola]
MGLSGLFHPFIVLLNSPFLSETMMRSLLHRVVAQADQLHVNLQRGRGECVMATSRK